LSAALGAAAGTALEIAVFPGGTLNHFARDAGIPVDDPKAALEVAVHGAPRPVDLGNVNGQAILNTSSVGLYTEFVRRRDALERTMTYRAASVAAAAAVWRDRRILDVNLDAADGTRAHFRTPLLFVGIHERILTPAGLGTRRPGGARALHILVVREPPKLRAPTRPVRRRGAGSQAPPTERVVEAYLTSGATVEMTDPPDTIAIDGELRTASWPLRYVFVPGAVRVVVP
jgi:diacylglycerol kinase family enzyme